MLSFIELNKLLNGPGMENFIFGVHKDLWKDSSLPVASESLLVKDFLVY
jgi:hypothetical protein